ncbi:MAG TPA: hypothetical protein VFI39_08915 [Gemmatimonadales bacterium]|nr:hypothetical protein [Gemmatimonadales bacterium]
MIRTHPIALLLLSWLPAACAPHPHRPTIHLSLVSTTRIPGGTAGLAGPPMLSPTLPGGRRIAWTEGSANAVVLDSTGAVRGPLVAIGAIRSVLVGAGDTVVVISDGKIALHDRDLRPIRSFEAPPGVIGSAAELGNGWFALAPAAAAKGSPVLLVDRTGREVGSLRSLDSGLVTVRAVEAGAQSTIWTAQLFGKLEFDRFDTTGRAVELIPLRRDWFPPRLAIDASPPAARVVGFWHGDADRFWLVGAVPHAESGLGLAPAEAIGAPADSSGVDGVIEVTDPVETTVIASTRFDGGFDQVVEPGLVSRVRRGADGGWLVDLYRVDLH